MSSIEVRHINKSTEIYGRKNRITNLPTVADEANDAAEDDDPLEDGEDWLYLTIPTRRSSTGTSSVIPPVSSGHSSPSAMESSLSSPASGVDDTSITIWDPN